MHNADKSKQMSRSLALLALVTLAGCASTRPAPQAVPPPEPEPVAEVDAPAAAPAVARVAPPPAPRPAPPPRHDVAVLFEASTPSAAAIVAEVESTLPAPRYRVTAITLGTGAPELPAAPAAIVAVGREAVDAARALSADTPIVFAQVFAYEQVLAAGGAVWGVQSLPPLHLQLEAWKTLDPSLARVGVILSAAHARWAADALAAARATSIDMTLETSASDRETLYLFKRLAPRLDGLWLLPDNEVLGPAVLNELIDYATSHGVSVLSFNDALLPRGALVSVSSAPEDVAEKIRYVLDRVVAGDTEDLPAMTALSVAALQVNPSVAAALELPPVPESAWVTRD
jgi:hypothetical protein